MINGTKIPRCCLQYKGIKIQANHNLNVFGNDSQIVVAYSTKVLKFKQITTRFKDELHVGELLLIVQRY